MLSVNNLRKHYLNPNGTVAAGVFDVEFQLGQGEFFTLLGPSGCGKTTTLRCVAGLEQPDKGRIAIGGTTVFDGDRGLVTPMQRRRIGMVFQSYAVWPHMTVFENTAYPLRYGPRHRSSATDIRARVMAVLDSVGLAQLADRPAPKLSGGQQQRLALARALVGKPELLLLDEPLSNLDATLRDQMRRELRRVQQETGVTALYVTHDQSEALSMSDRVAVMKDGRVEQLSTPIEIYRNPASRFVAEFIGHSNMLEGRVLSEKNGMANVETPIGVLTGRRIGAATANAATVLLRPEFLEVRTAGQETVPAENRLQAKVVETAFMGEVTEYLLDICDIRITLRRKDHDLTTGDSINIFIKESDVSIL